MDYSCRYWCLRSWEAYLAKYALSFISIFSFHHIDALLTNYFFVLVHLNSAGHWAFFVIYMKKQEIIYFDPLQYDGSKYLQAALNWLRHEAIDKKSLSLADLTPESCTWKLIQERENQPQQKGNGTECGVFLCVTADCVADDIPITSTLYTLNDMRVHNYRRKLGCDILRGSFHEYPTVFA